MCSSTRPCCRKYVTSGVGSLTGNTLFNRQHVVLDRIVDMDGRHPHQEWLASSSSSPSSSASLSSLWAASQPFSRPLAAAGLNATLQDDDDDDDDKNMSDGATTASQSVQAPWPAGTAATASFRYDHLPGADDRSSSSNGDGSSINRNGGTPSLSAFTSASTSTSPSHFVSMASYESNNGPNRAHHPRAADGARSPSLASGEGIAPSDNNHRNRPVVVDGGGGGSALAAVPGPQRPTRSSSHVAAEEHFLPRPSDSPRSAFSFPSRLGGGYSQRSFGGGSAAISNSGTAVAQPFQVMPSPYARASVDMHSPSLGMGSSPSTPEFSVFVGDLSPDLREEDLVTQFLHPPPWPPQHPFALAYAHARKMQGEPAAPDEIFGPAPFLSTKSAKIMSDPVTGMSKGFGFVRFTNEADCKRAFIEMQGVILTPASGASPGRPVRISTASVKQKSSGSTTPSQLSTSEQNLLMTSDMYGLRRSDGSEGAGSHTPPYPPVTSGAPSTTPKYSSPTPESIALQSTRQPYPSRLGVPTLPGFPTIPATGALGPTDVGLSSGVMLGSSFGGPASLAGTGFTLGPSTLPSPTSALDPNNTTVFVGGLSSLISEETLKTFFAPFGMIAYVKIPPGKGCGFVSFTQKVDAERAIERMQGFPIGGCRIRLSWGRSQGEKNQHLAAQHIASMGQLAGYNRGEGGNTSGVGHTSGSLTAQQAAQLARVANWSGIPSSSQYNSGGNNPSHGASLDALSDPYVNSFGYVPSSSAPGGSARGGFTFDTAESRRLTTATSPQDELGRLGLPSSGGHHSAHSMSAVEFGGTGADLTSLFGGMSVSQTSPAHEKWPSPWNSAPATGIGRSSNSQWSMSGLDNSTVAPSSAAVGSPPGSSVNHGGNSRSSREDLTAGDESSKHLQRPNNVWYDGGYGGAGDVGPIPIATRGSSGDSSKAMSTSRKDSLSGSGFAPFSPIIAAPGEGKKTSSHDELKKSPPSSPFDSNNDKSSDYEDDGPFFHPGLSSH